MLKQLHIFLKSKIDFSEKELLELVPYISLKKYEKNELVIREGETFNFIGFLNRGLIRSYILDNGKELTSRFTFENCVFTYLEGLLDDRFSHKTFQALEYSEVLILKKDDLPKILSMNPKFESIFRILLFDESVMQIQNIEDERKETPTNRYLKFLKENPEIYNRLSIKDIASYLGIEPQSLSRIRKRLATNHQK